MHQDKLYGPFSISLEKLYKTQNINGQHNFFELIYILAGRGKKYINENIFNYQRGQLFLVKPNEYHLFETETTTELFFLRFNNTYIESDILNTDNIKQLDFIFQNTNYKSCNILNSKTDKVLVKAAIKIIIEEIKNKDLYNSKLVQQLVNTIIIVVARNIAKNLSKSISENTDGRIIEILNYIQNNIYCPEKLRTKTISKHFNISENYLGRYFKKHCNETLQDYITNCKITLIEQRLIHSDRRINEIVTEFSFTDESHLNKFFKQHHGISPTIYRNGNIKL